MLVDRIDERVRGIGNGIGMYRSEVGRYLVESPGARRPAMDRGPPHHHTPLPPHTLHQIHPHPHLHHTHPHRLHLSYLVGVIQLRSPVGILLDSGDCILVHTPARARCRDHMGLWGVGLALVPHANSPHVLGQENILLVRDGQRGG